MVFWSSLEQSGIEACVTSFLVLIVHYIVLDSSFFKFRMTPKGLGQPWHDPLLLRTTKAGVSVDTGLTSMLKVETVSSVSRYRLMPSDKLTGSCCIAQQRHANTMCA